MCPLKNTPGLYIGIPYGVRVYWPASSDPMKQSHHILNVSFPSLAATIQNVLSGAECNTCGSFSTCGLIRPFVITGNCGIN